MDGLAWPIGLRGKDASDELMRLATVERSIGRFDEAVEHFQKVAELRKAMPRGKERQKNICGEVPK